MAGPREGHTFLRIEVVIPSFPGLLFLGLAIVVCISFSVIAGKGNLGSSIGSKLASTSSEHEAFCKSARTR